MPLLLAYLAVILIWSTTPLAIQWSGQQDWLVGVAGRIFISALLIIPILLFWTRQRFSLKKQDLLIYLAASLGMLGGMTPMYYAAQTMPSGWVSLLFGLTPMVTGLFAYFILHNMALTLSKYLGLLVGFIGLMVVLAPNLSWQTAAGKTLLTGLGFALLSVTFHSLSTVLVKKLNHGLPNTHIVAGAVWISSLVYLLLHPQFLIELPALPNRALSAIVYLGVFGSLIGFILYYYVLRHLDAVRLGLITLITPIIALLLGHFLNQEPLNATIWTGAGLVILGLVLFEFGHRVSRESFRLLLNRMF
ncbi:MAG: DMT family transporter [Hydrogenovibrio sp.]